MSDNFGPFSIVLGIAAALAAVFTKLALEMVGKISRWTWLFGYQQSFVVATAARFIAVGLVGLIFITINKTNYVYYGGTAVVIGVIGAWLAMKFDHLRTLHTCSIPDLAPNGSQAVDEKGNPKSKAVVIGVEQTMHPDAAKQYVKHKRPGLCKFMSGYGVNSVNDPESIWSKAELADITQKLVTMLTVMVLCGVVALYLAASAVEMHLR